MAGGKLTPRQKMINMMYLVLTALLALNVSQEVLNAFKIVNDGLKTSNSSLKGKNDLIYDQFAVQAESVPKAKELYPIAMEVKQVSKQIFDDIEQYKKQIIDGSKGINPESGDIVQRDNIDVTTRIFVENGGKKGKDLYKKLADARAKFLKILTDNKLSNVPISLNPDDVLKGKKKDIVSKGWEYAAFNHVPSTAAVTILSKFQNDVIASEGAVIDELFKGISAKSFKFDDLAAAVIAPSSYLMQGQKYTAQIFVAASSKGSDPEVFIGSLPAGAQKIPGTEQYSPIESADGKVSGEPLKVEAGKGIYERAASSVGEQKYTGVIRVKNPDGVGYKLYPFSGGFQVGAKSIVVSPTKMNVLYIGVDNPMKISCAGVQSQDVIASFEGDGQLTKSPDGSYVARVKTPGKTKINVSAKVDGKVQPMGTEEFRIKRIPDPVPTVGGVLRGGPESAGKLKVQSGLVPRLENFDFEARFNVVSFKVGYQKGPDYFEESIQGPMFNDKVKSILNGLKPKQIIIFDDIKVVGPDGTPRKIPQLAFKII
jgi:hypothetical protein